MFNEDLGGKDAPFHLFFCVSDERPRDVTFKSSMVEREYDAGGAEEC